jgi:hypothetical protein
MPRSLILAILFATSASAIIWPEHLGTYDRRSVQESQVASDENGREAAEQADYGRFQVSATRYKDSTGAYAGWLETEGNPVQVGNYVITCTGNCPKNLEKLAEALPRISHAPLPALGSYFPTKNLVPHSQRYVLGPAGLAQNAPQIPESAVAFQFGTEGEIARYRVLRNKPENDATVAVFSYPTPQIARQQASALEKIAGAAVKRTGPLVALVLGAPDQAAADRLLGQINYEASVTINEPMPLVLRPETAAQMLLSIITLAGIVLAFCLASGLLFGGFRVIARRFGYTDAGTAMTTLHLSDK